MKSEPTSHHGNGVQSVHRALDLIEVIHSSGGPMNLVEIAESADLTMPTAHRLLNTMVDRGFLRRFPDRRYGLGARLIPLGSSASWQITGDTTDTLARLAAGLGESATFSIRSGDHAEYVAQVASPNNSMRMFTEVGSRVPLHCTAVGKSMLAQLEPSESRKLVTRLPLEPMTKHTIVDRDELLDNLDLIRTQGYAIDEQEQELGVRCVAVAFPHVSLGSAALSISGPSTRMTDELIERAAIMLKESADSLVSMTAMAMS